ncbi:hypothetical protein ZIOFF_007107 [Zingiber officinale]|uniref:Uncharacterized protein n=1 Tax=Zingiber officinale TaxID=94328 RepID=A0A8J5I3E5_ZINOF|nr:hypothetical protein ZIOFF_007107 [Zingiber officinale]
MELQAGRSSPAKAAWNQVQVAFFVMRKSFAWKQRQLLSEIKLLGKALGDFVFGTRPERPLFGPREYEFSCSNTPNYPIVCGRRRSKAGKRRSGYLLPCLHGSVAAAEPEEYFWNSSPRRATVIFPAAAKSVLFSPLASPAAFAVRISNYSSDDEYLGRSAKVDDEAEEFIRKFYEQLRVQSRMALLHYQEKEFQETLARGL